MTEEYQLELREFFKALRQAVRLIRATSDVRRGLLMVRSYLDRKYPR